MVELKFETSIIVLLKYVFVKTLFINDTVLFTIEKMSLWTFILQIFLMI